ncbi:MAG: HPr-rel-A system PqqD family peptide chaperone [Halioglobus sp.]
MLKKPPEVLLEDINGLLACYSSLTGQTHILDTFPAEILRSLADGPRTASEIKHSLAELIDEEVDWFDKINEVLAELHSLQLLDARPA